MQIGNTTSRFLPQRFKPNGGQSPKGLNRPVGTDTLTFGGKKAEHSPAFLRRFARNGLLWMAPLLGMSVLTPHLASAGTFLISMQKIPSDNRTFEDKLKDLRKQVDSQSLWLDDYRALSAIDSQELLPRTLWEDEHYPEGQNLNQKYYFEILQKLHQKIKKVQAADVKTQSLLDVTHQDIKDRLEAVVFDATRELNSDPQKYGVKAAERALKLLNTLYGTVQQPGTPKEYPFSDKMIHLFLNMESHKQEALLPHMAQGQITIIRQVFHHLAQDLQLDKNGPLPSFFAFYALQYSQLRLFFLNLKDANQAQAFQNPQVQGDVRRVYEKLLSRVVRRLQSGEQDPNMEKFIRNALLVLETIEPLVPPGVFIGASESNETETLTWNQHAEPLLKEVENLPPNDYFRQRCISLLASVGAAQKHPQIAKRFLKILQTNPSEENLKCFREALPQLVAACILPNTSKTKTVEKQHLDGGVEKALESLLQQFFDHPPGPKTPEPEKKRYSAALGVASRLISLRWDKIKSKAEIQRNQKIYLYWQDKALQNVRSLFHDPTVSNQDLGRTLKEYNNYYYSTNRYPTDLRIAAAPQLLTLMKESFECLKKADPLQWERGILMLNNINNLQPQLNNVHSLAKCIDLNKDLQTFLADINRETKPERFAAGISMAQPVLDMVLNAMVSESTFREKSADPALLQNGLTSFNRFLDCLKGAMANNMTKDVVVRQAMVEIINKLHYRIPPPRSYSSSPLFTSDSDKSLFPLFVVSYLNHLPPQESVEDLRKTDTVMKDYNSIPEVWKAYQHYVDNQLGKMSAPGKYDLPSSGRRFLYASLAEQRENPVTIDLFRRALFRETDPQVLGDIGKHLAVYAGNALGRMSSVERVRYFADLSYMLKATLSTNVLNADNHVIEEVDLPVFGVQLPDKESSSYEDVLRLIASQKSPKFYYEMPDRKPEKSPELLKEFAALLNYGDTKRFIDNNDFRPWVADQNRPESKQKYLGRFSDHEHLLRVYNNGVIAFTPIIKSLYWVSDPENRYLLRQEQLDNPQDNYLKAFSPLIEHNFISDNRDAIKQMADVFTATIEHSINRYPISPTMDFLPEDKAVRVFNLLEIYQNAMNTFIQTKDYQTQKISDLKKRLQGTGNFLPPSVISENPEFLPDGSTGKKIQTVKFEFPSKYGFFERIQDNGGNQVLLAKQAEFTEHILALADRVFVADPANSSRDRIEKRKALEAFLRELGLDVLYSKSQDAKALINQHRFDFEKIRQDEMTHPAPNKQ